MHSHLYALLDSFLSLLPSEVKIAAMVTGFHSLGFDVLGARVIAPYLSLLLVPRLLHPLSCPPTFPLLARHELVVVVV